MSIPLVLGTHNLKKKKEMQILLAPFGLKLLHLADFPNAIDVQETGTTFGENSRLKASEQARHLRQWVVGEDSGLEVDALMGRPGVFSARFSGPEATDERNNLKLLEELREVPLEKRTARYVCHLSISDPDGNIRAEEENYCRGRILWEPVGNHGFGYDPLFEVIEYHQTFGQLSDLLKACLSHRARAMRAFLPKILQLDVK
ncbi:MAG: RdgB/HAM1 family non-canonical purine NTP pyrophosphatase [Planctomycetia bacterium]|nr:RdgB/HAM1 family non-canonical purine NTP pyrophosphatase [Planctomycetia bacterium]